MNSTLFLEVPCLERVNGVDLDAAKRSDWVDDIMTFPSALSTTKSHSTKGLTKLLPIQSRICHVC